MIWNYIESRKQLGGEYRNMTLQWNLMKKVMNGSLFMK